MSKTFEQGKDEVAKLCQYFATNQQSFRATGIKEQHVRQSLIDPFFESLDWDVHNTGKVAPQYREVIPEDSLDVEGHQRAPDYTFRVGMTPKFFAEAKKCGINSVDPGPAQQLRSYGFSAKMVLSILTDFEELGVYDCTIRPRLSDKASHARIQYFRFEEYRDRWREIWDVFSREAVWSGAFDKYAASKRKRGTSEVDVEFLKEIEGWRDALAHNVALRNESISSDDLNAAVQFTIDRIVFLRMAEDRGIEPYEQLLKLCERSGIYTRFMNDVCHRADEKYNSGLFHFHKEEGLSELPDRITPNLIVDDKLFKSILQSLYFAYGSPYHFGVLPVEILGTVYERFLGKVIRLTAGHHAKIEEKPEVRKAGGVYYTPAYVVDYIVKHTVGKQIGGKSPGQLAGGKKSAAYHVLDMACGSGSFLLGAYQCLLDHCLKWYIEHKPDTHKKTIYRDPRTLEWRLTIEEKKRILTTHLFGVDIDPQAVEVSKLSLLLKALEGETDATLSMQLKLFHERALPNLADNIKCGNSLIGSAYFTGSLLPDSDEIKRVNPFDWHKEFPVAMKAGGFDCVIGNPPYIRMEAFAEIKEYLRRHYTSHEERADFYTYFIEKGLGLLNKFGTMGMIVSNKFSVAKYGEPLRRCIERTADVLQIVDLAGVRVFHGATVRTMILLLKLRGNGETQDIRYVPVPPPAEFQKIEAGVLSVTEYAKSTGASLAREQLSAATWQLIPAAHFDLLRRLTKGFPSLRAAFKWRPLFGIKTGLNDAFIINGAVRDELVREDEACAEVIRPFLMGKDVRRYSIRDEGRFVIYLHPDKRIENHPTIRKHLEPFRDALSSRAGSQLWYELQQPAVSLIPLLARPKIVYPIIAPEPRFALDTSGYLINDKLFVLPTDSLFLLGILNSTLSRMFFAAVCARLEGSGECYYEFRAQFVERFPIRPIELSKPDDKAGHDSMVRLVESMLSLHEQLNAAKSGAQKTAIQRQIEATDAEIDRLVYALYGLTQEEIAVVEQAIAR